MKPTRLLTLSTLLALSLLFSTNPAQAQISVSIPNWTEDEPGTVEVPINVETEIDENDGVTSYEFGIEFDSDLIEINEVITESTLSEDIGNNLIVNHSDGSIYVTTAGVSPISGGPAPLVILEVQILEGVTGRSPLHFAGDEDQYAFRFNESDPSSIATSGSVSINTSSSASDLIINEIHADPASESDCEALGEPPDCGDANNDGTRSATEDEFIEIINASSSPIDISGYTISDNVGERFAFPEGTTLAPNTAAVVFGGGDPTDIPGLVFTAGTLALNNDGDTVTLKDNGGNIVTAAIYVGNALDENQSITRSPDIEGPFALHTEASPIGELYSPGRTIDGGELPVELSAFEAVRDGRDVVLQWSTASETNNSGFTVQQRVNGAFQDVGFVEGAGTVATPQDYTYRVSDLASGTHTFRLEQVDIDGTTMPSREVEVTVSLEQPFTLEAAYPNPFRTKAAFTLRVQETQEVTVTLFNALGQRVQEVFAGTVRADVPETFTIEGERLPSGMYLYRVDGRTFSASKQIARVK